MYLLWKLGFLLSVGYIALNLYLAYKRRKYNHFVSPHIPLSWRWFMGHVTDLTYRRARSPNKNFVQLITEYHEGNGWDMYRLSLFNDNIVYCVDLTIAPKLMTDQVNFSKGPIWNITMGRLNRVAGERLMGRNELLFTDVVEVWKAKRRILDPAFKKNFLRRTMCEMNKIGSNLMEVLRNKAEGEVFDITGYLNRSALEAVSVCGFDWTERLIKEHGEMARNMANALVEVVAKANKQPLEFYLPWVRNEEKARYKKTMMSVRGTMREHLKKRMTGDSKDDILSHIIRTNECSDELDIEDLIDEYIIFLLAGMETTGITMAIVLQFLTSNPDEYRKVQEEVDSVFGEDEELCYEDIAKLEYLEMVIKESLRLRGPVHGTYRYCKNSEVTVAGVHLPQYTKLFISFHVLQNDARYWDNPKEFNPSRFSRENVKKIQPFTYTPFSAGPRNCIGKNFAMLEMKVVLSKMFKEFFFVNPCPDVKDPPRLGYLTLRPLNGVQVKRYDR